MPLMEDIDEAFDNIVLAEERFQQQGHEEGALAGRQSGLQEGKLLGIEQGAKIGSELGFYHGFAQRWSVLGQQNKKNTRIQKAITSLLGMIEDFPLSNPHETSIEDRMLKIRAKFKQISSLLHISTKSGSSTVVSF